ncbi:UNVERIFIED_CONTAM: hypothetical protein Scaly_2300400 [Sesamum calycinum]|uniref:Uncharacterized protein n=1 Tax=Sesamum calycinum TaxID=2727403 RepID=A0AAW2MC38_9LAMI
MAEPISVAIPIAPKVDLTGLPDKFSGQFFKRWQQRMKIWLTMKGLLTVIQVTRPEPTDTDPKTAEIAQWTERDQIGRGAILSALSNTSTSIVSTLILPNLFGMSWTGNIILKSKGSKSILFLSSCGIRWLRIVDKFPKSWENFGMTLKHQKGRLSLDDLMIAISIEEEHRNQTHKMPTITGKTVSMGNSSTAEVLGIGSVDLKFPSGRILSLKRVHHVPTVRRNIISGSETKPQILSSVGVPSKSACPEHKRKKLGPKIVDAVFLGYVETSYALRFLVIKSEIPGIEVNTIVEFRDAVFLEDVFL